MIRLSHWIRTATEKWHERSGRDPSVRPIDGYPSSIVDAQGCEFSSEIRYHIGYAYHLSRHGLLRRTISCQDTSCFYWFSPQHIERDTHRGPVKHFASVDQVPGETPALNRWNLPDFRAQYQSRLDFGFDRMLLPLFNTRKGVSHGRPINFFSQKFLTRLAKLVQGKFQLVYFGPPRSANTGSANFGSANKESEDDGSACVGDTLVCDETEHALRSFGVVMGDELFAATGQSTLGITYNEFQLTLLAQSPIRIASQSDTGCLNAMFPGHLFVARRRDASTFVETCNDLQRAVGSTITMLEDEFILLHHLVNYLGGGSSSAKKAA